MAEQDFKVSDDSIRDTNKPGIERFNYTGHDGDGTEVGVRVGCGVINHMEVTDNGMVKPGFDFRIGKHSDEKITRANYKEKGGWIPSRETKMIEFVKNAAENGTPILYRIESPRTKDIDKSIPIADVPASKHQAHLVAVAPIDAGTMREHPENWMHSSEILVDPSEDKAHEYGVNHRQNSAFGHAYEQEKPVDTVVSGYGRLDLFEDVVTSDAMGEFAPELRVKMASRLVSLLGEVAGRLGTDDALRIVGIAFRVNAVTKGDLSGKEQMGAYLGKVEATAKTIASLIK